MSHLRGNTHFSFLSLPKLVSNDDLFAEIKEVNSDNSNYSNNMCDTTAKGQLRQSHLARGSLIT